MLDRVRVEDVEQRSRTQDTTTFDHLRIASSVLCDGDLDFARQLVRVVLVNAQRRSVDSHGHESSAALQILSRFASLAEMLEILNIEPVQDFSRLVTVLRRGESNDHQIVSPIGRHPGDTLLLQELEKKLDLLLVGQILSLLPQVDQNLIFFLVVRKCSAVG